MHFIYHNHALHMARDHVNVNYYSRVIITCLGFCLQQVIRFDFYENFLNYDFQRFDYCSLTISYVS